MSKIKPDALASDIKRVAKELKKDPSEMTKLDYASSGKFTEWDFRNGGGFSTIMKTYFPQKVDNSAKVELSQVRQKQAKLEKNVGSIDLFLERFGDIAKKLPQIKVKAYKPKKSASIDRAVTVLLSDLHIGSDLVMEEHGHVYGVKEEARALAAVLKSVIEYKLDHRDKQELIINIAGDTFESQLHGASSADLIHIQTCRTMWLLQQFIAQASQHYPKVTVNMTPGNHGRDTAVNPKRAIDQKYNALETTVYYGVRLACKQLKNVSFHQPKTPWISYEVLGHKMYLTHGDGHFNVGNPGKSLNVSGLEATVNRINATLKDTEEFKVFMCGHTHTPTATSLPNGAYVIVNGALTPPNAFAESLGIMESQQIQMMFETTKSFAVGDLRFVNASESHQDKSLDKLIQPFPGL